MNNAKWVSKDELLATAVESFMPTDVLLDIGCGIMPQNFIVPSVHICAEPYMEYVEKLQEKTAYECDRSYVILNSTWEQALKTMPPKSVDTVILADVIEHLEKNIAVKLIKQTEALARQQILIFTPLGFLPQSHPDGIDAWGLSGGDWQEHKSGWGPEDFGDEWEIIGAKKYYFEDNLGRSFDEPYGAFWAIRKFGDAPCKKRLECRNLASLISIAVAKLNCPAAIKWNVALLVFAVALKNFMSRMYSLFKHLANRFGASKK